MNDRGMTLIEVLIALVIASSIIAFALEVSRFTVNRSATSILQLEAVLEAESLLSRVGLDIPLRTGKRSERVPSRGISWTLDIRPLDERPAWPHAYQVSSEITVSRASLSEKYRLSTVKLQWSER